MSVQGYSRCFDHPPLTSGLPDERTFSVRAGMSQTCGRSRMLKHIAEFFAIEKDIRGRSAGERRLVRQQRGRPLADAFQKWLRT
jgi:hypothetical protein